MIGWLTRKITRERLDKFLASNSTDKKVLNLGCGNTDHRKFFPNVVNTDVILTGQTEVIADTLGLPFADKSFEVVLTTEVLEHVRDPQRAINEMRRVLKAKGKLILTTRFIYPLHEVPTDYFRFTKYGLKYLLAGWKKVEIIEEANTKDTMAILLQRIGYQSVILTKIPLINLLLHFLAKCVVWLPNIVTKEFGDIRREKTEHNILSSGYYVVAEK